MDLLQLLQQGGYGIAAIFGIVIGILWRDLKQKETRIFKLLDKQAEILKQFEELRKEDK